MPVRELSVFFPCFDEEANVETVVQRALAVLRDRDLDRFEVIVVDDGSRDETGARADKLAARFEEVRVVHHAENQGYGAALRSGFTAAALPWIFFTDGDGQFDLEELDPFLLAAEEADVVIGYRRQGADHLGRRVNTWLWGLTVRGLFGLRVRDIDCAFKLLSRRARPHRPAHRFRCRHQHRAPGRGTASADPDGRDRGLPLPPFRGKPHGGEPQRVILRALRELLGLRVRDGRRSHGG